MLYANLLGSSVDVALLTSGAAFCWHGARKARNQPGGPDPIGRSQYELDIILGVDPEVDAETLRKHRREARGLGYGEQRHQRRLDGGRALLS